MAYASVADVRAEGVPSSGSGAKTDQQIQTALDRATLLIDRFTARFFAPRALTLLVDGKGGTGLLLGHPIISIASVELIGRDVSGDVTDLDLQSVRIYNRHLSGLLEPDDRENPRIDLLSLDQRDESTVFANDLDSSFYLQRWPVGTQNIRIVGVFGYTDKDTAVSPNPQGVTPALIARACVLMTLKDLEPRYNAGAVDDSYDARNAYRLTELRTRDQTIKWASPEELGSRGVGAFTGDPEVDTILAMFVAPPRLGAA